MNEYMNLNIWFISGSLSKFTFRPLNWVT